MLLFRKKGKQGTKMSKSHIKKEVQTKYSDESKHNNASGFGDKSQPRPAAEEQGL